MATLTANEKWQIAQLVASDQFKTIDNHHTHADGPDLIYEWWIIDVRDHAHVIFETANNKTEYDAKDREAHAFVEEQRQLQIEALPGGILGQIMALVSGLSEGELRDVIRRLRELVGDPNE